MERIWSPRCTVLGKVQRVVRIQLISCAKEEDPEEGHTDLCFMKSVGPSLTVECLRTRRGMSEDTTFFGRPLLLILRLFLATYRFGPFAFQ